MARLWKIGSLERWSLIRSASLLQGTRIQGVITAQELTQVAAAKRMGLSQPDVSRLLNGQFRDVSVERLMRLLTRLGCDVDITIRNHGKAAAPRDTIRLQAASV